ncbi:MAG: AAA family ATPase [Pseudanabaena sp. ELA607]|jgi:predicted kinase
MSPANNSTNNPNHNLLTQDSNPASSPDPVNASVVMLMGIPGSGKSHLAEKILSRHPHSTEIISPDLIRQILYGNAAIQGQWAEVWHEVQNAFASAARRQKNVIYDATNYQRAYRQDMIDLARRYGFRRITGIWLNVPLWLCLSRNEVRSRQVPEEIIIEMYRHLIFNPPTLEEGFTALLLNDDKLDEDWID